MNENNQDEGWIALAVVLFLVVCIVTVVWEPDVEAIGSWIYERGR